MNNNKITNLTIWEYFASTTTTLASSTDDSADGVRQIKT